MHVFQKKMHVARADMHFLANNMHLSRAVFDVFRGTMNPRAPATHPIPAALHLPVTALCPMSRNPEFRSFVGWASAHHYVVRRESVG